MTRSYHFLQFDVFTATPFGGNQLAVFLSAEGLSDSEMQTLARELNYSETTYVLPPADPAALARVRIFTPTAELPFAGHPTIGTTFALAHAARITPHTPQPATLELGIGPIAVTCAFADERVTFVWMTQPLPHFSPWQGDRARLAAALSLSPSDLLDDLPIEHGSSGAPFIYIPLRARAALAAARPGSDLEAALGDSPPHVGAYLFTLDAPLPDPTAAPLAARSRMFAPAMGIAEDPATGSAAGPFAAYLARHQRLAPAADGATRLSVAQGVEMGRPSAITAELTFTANHELHEIRVGGASAFVAEGTYYLPDA